LLEVILSAKDMAGHFADYDFYEDGRPMDGHEWLTEYYEDEGEYPVLQEEERPEWADTDGDPWRQAMSVAEVLEHCVAPTVESGAAHVGKVVAWCVVFRICTQTGANTYIDTGLC